MEEKSHGPISGVISGYAWLTSLKIASMDAKIRRSKN